MTHTTLPRILAAVTLAASAALTLTSCGEFTAPGELGENQKLLSACPPNHELATLVLVDGTGSSGSNDILQERLAIIERQARETAVCGGHLTVSVYSAGSAATATLYDGELALPGATDNARLRRVPEAVEEIMAAVEGAYAEAVSSLPGGGSDITGVWRLAAEQQAQLGDGYLLRYVNLTDGLDNVSVDAGSLGSADEATALAQSVVVPELSGAEVIVAGIGRIASDSVPSRTVDALVAFYQQLCAQSAAASCLVVTDWR